MLHRYSNISIKITDNQTSASNFSLGMIKSRAYFNGHAAVPIFCSCKMKIAVEKGKFCSCSFGWIK